MQSVAYMSACFHHRVTWDISSYFRLESQSMSASQVSDITIISLSQA